MISDTREQEQRYRAEQRSCIERIRGAESNPQQAGYAARDQHGKAADQIGERSLPRVETNKRMLGGPVCRALIVNPCVTDEDMKKEHGIVVQRARRAGIELLLGPHSVDNVVHYIAELASSRVRRDTP